MSTTTPAPTAGPASISTPDKYLDRDDIPESTAFRPWEGQGFVFQKDDFPRTEKRSCTDLMIGGGFAEARMTKRTAFIVVPTPKQKPIRVHKTREAFTSLSQGAIHKHHGSKAGANGSIVRPDCTLGNPQLIYKDAMVAILNKKPALDVYGRLVEKDFQSTVEANSEAHHIMAREHPVPTSHAGSSRAPDAATSDSPIEERPLKKAKTENAAGRLADKPGGPDV